MGLRCGLRLWIEIALPLWLLVGGSVEYLTGLDGQ